MGEKSQKKSVKITVIFWLIFQTSHPSTGTSSDGSVTWFTLVFSKRSLFHFFQSATHTKILISFSHAFVLGCEVKMHCVGKT